MIVCMEIENCYENIKFNILFYFGYRYGVFVCFYLIVIK